MRGYLERDDGNAALEVLGDFSGVAWQSVAYWHLPAEAAQELYLDARWFRWRASETRQDQFRPLWDLGGDLGVRVAVLWAEDQPRSHPVRGGDRRRAT